jgi:sensor c-di-GMP phosphodiesterase-like protein
MTYVVIAYGLVAGVLSAYGLHLFRERRSLRRRLAEALESDRT